MAKTIDQIQALIDSRSLDARQLINLIADYLQANPDGGITPTLAAVLAIDNDANGLTIENLLDPTTDQQAATKKYVDDNSGGASGIDDVLAIGQALAGNRTVDLDGNDLDFKQGDNSFLYLTTTVNSEQASLAAYNINDDGSSSYMNMNTSDVAAQFDLFSGFNGNIKTVGILGVVNASTATLSYTADTHTFNGVIINPELVAADFADDSAAGIGGIVVGGLYHTAGVVKVRLA